jgi:hypothetical protein
MDSTEQEIFYDSDTTDPEEPGDDEELQVHWLNAKI